jgi:uncharacterized phage protein (TIGR02218 family)
MKTFSLGLAAHKAGGSLTEAYLLRIVRQDGQQFTLSSHHSPLTVSGILYDTTNGLSVTSLVSSAGLNVGAMELTALDDGSFFTTLDIMNRVWSNANYWLMRVNYASPADGVEWLSVGIVGQVQVKQGAVVCELRDLRQYLQQGIVDYSSPTCRSRLGEVRYNGGSCALDLAPYTHNGSVVSVTSQSEFVLTFGSPSAAMVDDYFGEGQLQFTSGQNSGVSAKIKTFNSSGLTNLALPVFGQISPGDTVTAIAGCRGRFEEDCVAKFNNWLNFVGEPHRRGLNNITGFRRPGT